MGLDPFAVEVVEPLELHDQDGGQPPDLKLESRLLQLIKVVINDSMVILSQILETKSRQCHIYLLSGCLYNKDQPTWCFLHSEQ